MTVIILKMAVKTASFPDVVKQPLLLQQKPQIKQKAPCWTNETCEIQK